MPTEFNAVYELKTTAEVNKGNQTKFNYIIRTLADLFPTYRAEMLEVFYENENGAVEEIADADALATLPVFISVLLDLKTQINHETDVFFRDKLGVSAERADVTVDEWKDKANNKRTTKISDIFKPICHEDIITTFQHYIDHEIKDNDDFELCEKLLTQQTFDEKLAKVLEKFKDSLIKQHPAKKKFIEENQNELYKLLRLDIFLSSAIKVFIESDNAQKMDDFVFQKVPFRARYGGNVKLRKPFMALAFCLESLEIPPKNEAWWEVMLYLKGFSRRIYNKTPERQGNKKEGQLCKKDGELIPLADGTYEITDPQDGDLKKNFKGLSKAMFDKWYRLIVKKLETKLRPHPKENIKRVHILQKTPKDYLAVPRPTSTRDIDYIPNKFYELKLGRTWDDPEIRISKLQKIVNMPILFPLPQVRAIDMALKASLVSCKCSYDIVKQYGWRGWLGLLGGSTRGVHAEDFDHLIKGLYDQDPQLVLKKILIFRDELKQKNSKHLITLIDEVILLPTIDKLALFIDHKTLNVQMAAPETANILRKKHG